MSTTAMAERPLTKILMERWEQVSRKFGDLTEEVPAEKFDSSPVDGLRTCAEVVRHVAFWNIYVSDSLTGKEANDSANELPAAEYPTRQKALGALRESAKRVTAALQAQEVTPKMLELLMSFVEHTSEHYGQLVVYARLMGVIPPASRR